jgi:hypothetical protein
MTDYITFIKLAMILTFFILAAAISHGGLYFIGHIPGNTIVLNLFGNNSL